jgi:predicted small secreted protein
MMKKAVMFLVLAAAMIAFSGCNTISGAAKGAKEGMKKDAQAFKKSDQWMQENLW